MRYAFKLDLFSSFLIHKTTKQNLKKCTDHVPVNKKTIKIYFIQGVIY